VSGGFGIIDYFVVTIVTVLCGALLVRSPKKLLIFLPTFLTIDFFIPFGTQLTPYRIIPIMIFIWLVFSRMFFADRRYNPWIVLFILSIIASLSFALYMGDAGTRPVLRVAHYLGLTALFIFVCRMVRTPVDFESGVWGIFLAGLIHASYAAYQIVASRVGLPFRGIVYGDSGAGFAVSAGDGLIRVNGLADEPKRLGYILLCAAIVALLYLARSLKGGRIAAFWPIKAKDWTPFTLGMIFILMLIMSLMTFSGSYILALGLTCATAVFLYAKRAVLILGSLALTASVLLVIAPDRFSGITAAVTDISESRIMEVEQGIEAANVYRQEFYVQDYLAGNPSSLVLSVGMGRYNTVFSQKYGRGVGLTGNGDVIPINSQIYEIGFDIGIFGLFILYIGGAILALRIRRYGITGAALCTMMLFMLFQSMLISNLQLLAVVAGLCAAFVSLRERQMPTGSNAVRIQKVMSIQRQGAGHTRRRKIILGSARYARENKNF